MKHAVGASDLKRDEKQNEGFDMNHLEGLGLIMVFSTPMGPHGINSITSGLTGSRAPNIVISDCSFGTEVVSTSFFCV